MGFSPTLPARPFDVSLRSRLKPLWDVGMLAAPVVWPDLRMGRFSLRKNSEQVRLLGPPRNRRHYVMVSVRRWETATSSGENTLFALVRKLIVTIPKHARFAGRLIHYSSPVKGNPITMTAVFVGSRVNQSKIFSKQIPVHAVA